jgi:hypothetical protein
LLRDISLRCAPQLASFQTGMMSMAIAGPAHDADKCCESAKTRLRLPCRASFIPNRLTLSVVVCAMALAGCARDPARHESVAVQHEARAAPVRTHKYTSLHRYAELRVHRADPALLAPQPAPDCEFKRTDVGTVDPNEWTRLKIDYERQCYQNAEKTARDRLRLLQASSTCEIERPVQHPRPAR